MLLRSRHPWLLSASLHLVLGGLVLVLVSFGAASPPQVLRMRLVGGPAAAGPGSGRLPVGSESPVPRPYPATPGEAAPPAWRALSEPRPAAVPVMVPASLDELLEARNLGQSEPSPGQPAPGWSNASGEGYAPPPLPPPEIAPPQGAAWNLVISVPAGGGGAAAIDGLDSGHPALDRWLEDYLRTVSFPSSPDGREYQTRWNLRLVTGKPQ